MAPGDPAGTGETARTLRLKCQAAQPQPQRGPREIAVPVQRIRHIPQASGMSQGGPSGCMSVEKLVGLEIAS